jgi:hypothetical protein
VAENFGSMIITYLSGVLHDRYIYMKSGFYAVSLLLGTCGLIAACIAFYYKALKDKQFALEDEKVKIDEDGEELESLKMKAK